MRIALLTSNTAYRDRFRRDLTLFGGDFELVYTGNDPRSNFQSLCKAHPDIIIIRTGEPGFYTSEVFKRIPKMLGLLAHNQLPNTKLLIQFDRDLNESLIEKAKTLGINYIDAAFDTVSLREALTRIHRGATVEMTTDIRFETYTRELRRI